MASHISKYRRNYIHLGKDEYVQLFSFALVFFIYLIPTAAGKVKCLNLESV